MSPLDHDDNKENDAPAVAPSAPSPAAPAATAAAPARATTPTATAAAPARVAPPAATAAAASVTAPATPAPLSTAALLTAMLKSSAKISDLFFSPGKPPLVEINGKLSPASTNRVLSIEDTRRIGAELIAGNQNALENLKERGSCDVSYSLPGANRFRVNVFMQRGSCAVVMRVIPAKVPDFESLNLPAELANIVNLRNGIVLVTGPTGSGKSSTLAAIIDKINKEPFS